LILKCLGTLILLGAGGYLSLSFHRFEHRRLEVLDGYISLIYYIKGQIDCYAMPVADILARADPSLIGACLGLGRWSAAEGGGTPCALPAILQESRPYLAPECERLLTTFTGELGSALRAEQVARCDYYIDALTRERQKLADTLPARLRTAATLCLCCTIAAAVLLW
jgi:hypothetical protein